jgi:hypothetical protein
MDGLRDARAAAELKIMVRRLVDAASLMTGRDP